MPNRIERLLEARWTSPIRAAPILTLLLALPVAFLLGALGQWAALATCPTDDPCGSFAHLIRLLTVATGALLTLLAAAWLLTQPGLRRRHAQRRNQHLPQYQALVAGPPPQPGSPDERLLQLLRQNHLATGPDANAYAAGTAAHRLATLSLLLFLLSLAWASAYVPDAEFYYGEDVQDGLATIFTPFLLALLATFGFRAAASLRQRAKTLAEALDREVASLNRGESRTAVVPAAAGPPISYRAYR